MVEKVEQYLATFVYALAPLYRLTAVPGKPNQVVLFLEFFRCRFVDGRQGVGQDFILGFQGSNLIIGAVSVGGARMLDTVLVHHLTGGNLVCSGKIQFQKRSKRKYVSFEKRSSGQPLVDPSPLRFFWIFQKVASVMLQSLDDGTHRYSWNWRF